jgi:hypothetical protein
VVVTGSGPVFIGRGPPTGTSAPGTPGGSPDRAWQIVAGEIPARPAAFLERQAVAGLAAVWDAGKRVAVVQAVTGGPGVGKTQAAGAYARNRAAAGWPLVAWVTAETRDQLLAGLASVAIGWLGHHATSTKVRNSGLWNSDHVEEHYDLAFLQRLASLVEKGRSPAPDITK